METFDHPICRTLRDAALALPETSEGSSCVNRAFKVRTKNFAFLGEKPGEIKLMVKLSDSLEAARAMDDPRIGAGSIGWVTVRFAPGNEPDEAMLADWIVESFRTLAPKSVVKKLEG